MAVLWSCALLLTLLPVPQEYEAPLQEGFKHEAMQELITELITELQKENKNTEVGTRISSAMNVLSSIFAPFLPGLAGKLFNKLWHM